MTAEVLHQLDEIDADIQMTAALEKTPEHAFSDRIFGLDNRRFYQQADTPRHKKHVTEVTCF